MTMGHFLTDFYILSENILITALKYLNKKKIICITALRYLNKKVF